MSEVILHEPPALGGVLAEQLRAVGVALRREGLALAACLLGLTLLIAYMFLYSRRAGSDFAISFAPDNGPPLALFALVLPIGVWKGEEPARRSYHWSLPVARGPHTLVKVIFGWVWMNVGLAAFVAWSLALPLLLGASPPGYGAPAEAWEWMLPFTACTLMYLLGTVAVLLSDHPWRWLVGLSVAFLVVRGVSQLPGMEPVHVILEALWSGPFGLQTALTGRLFVETYAVNAAGRTMHSIRSEARADVWLRATALWLAVGLVSTVVAAHVHQERTR